MVWPHTVHGLMMLKSVSFSSLSSSSFIVLHFFLPPAFFLVFVSSSFSSWWSIFFFLFPALFLFTDCCLLSSYCLPLHPLISSSSEGDFGHHRSLKFLHHSMFHYHLIAFNLTCTLLVGPSFFIVVLIYVYFIKTNQNHCKWIHFVSNYNLSYVNLQCTESQTPCQRRNLHPDQTRRWKRRTAFLQGWSGCSCKDWTFWLV